MLKTCEQCGTEYLSESDPHAFVWRGKLWEDNCGCYFTNALVAQLAAAEDALKFYVNGEIEEDYTEEKTETIASYTGLNRKNSGVRIIEGVKKVPGKRAREYFAKYKTSAKQAENPIILNDQPLPEI